MIDLQRPLIQLFNLLRVQTAILLVSALTTWKTLAESTTARVMSINHSQNIRLHNPCWSISWEKLFFARLLAKFRSKWNRLVWVLKRFFKWHHLCSLSMRRNSDKSSRNITLGSPKWRISLQIFVKSIIFTTEDYSVTSSHLWGMQYQ